MIKKLKEKLPFSINNISFAKRDGFDFLDIELPDHNLKTIEEKSKIISQLLDEISPYESSYYLNVYSAGTEQNLDPNDLDQHLMANVQIETKKAYLEKNKWEGQLVLNTAEQIKLIINNKGRFQKLVVEKSDLELIKLSAKLKKEKN